MPLIQWIMQNLSGSDEQTIVDAAAALESQSLLTAAVTLPEEKIIGATLASESRLTAAVTLLTSVVTPTTTLNPFETNTLGVAFAFVPPRRKKVIRIIFTYRGKDSEFVAEEKDIHLELSGVLREGKSGPGIQCLGLQKKRSEVRMTLLNVLPR